MSRKLSNQYQREWDFSYLGDWNVSQMTSPPCTAEFHWIIVAFTPGVLVHCVSAAPACPPVLRWAALILGVISRTSHQEIVNRRFASLFLQRENTSLHSLSSLLLSLLPPHHQVDCSQGQFQCEVLTPRVVFFFLSPQRKKKTRSTLTLQVSVILTPINSFIKVLFIWEHCVFGRSVEMLVSNIKWSLKWSTLLLSQI